MLKWIWLALGVFLFANGIYTRIYGYSDPERHCFQMDLIGFVGCSASPAVPQLAMWSAILAGAGLILGCLVWAMRRKAPAA